MEEERVQMAACEIGTPRIVAPNDKAGIDTSRRRNDGSGW